jgi:hypothetical protein
MEPIPEEIILTAHLERATGHRPAGGEGAGGIAERLIDEAEGIKEGDLREA